MNKRILIIVFMLFSFASKAQWIAINSGITTPAAASAIATDGTYLYAGIADSLSGGMYRSSDMGDTWTAINSGLPSLSVWCITTSGSNIFISIAGYGIYLSTDFGNTWTGINSGLTSYYVHTIVAKDSVIYAGTGNAGVFKAIITTGSYNWAAINSGLSCLDVKSLAINDNDDVYAGTQAWSASAGGVYLSTNGGGSWSQLNSGLTGSSVNYISALFVNGPILLAGAGLATYPDPPGIFRANGAASGPSWTSSGSGIGYQVHSFHAVCDIIFAGCGGGGFLYSRDNGVSWTLWDFPTSTYIVSQTSIDSTLFAAGGGFFKRSAIDLCKNEQNKIILEMPNVFTPNNDGINDHFIPLVAEGIDEARLTIYNRWGEKLIETADLTLGWDGKCDNKDCSDGTYFWTINYTTVKGEQFTIKGFVTLIK